MGQTLPDDLLREWKELVTDLGEGGPISVPRSYLHGVEGCPTKLTICGFGDASTQAYAAVVYLVLQTNSSISVRFVVSKTRVAPLQFQTIPRLELLSALLLSKLVVSVVACLRSTLPPVEVRCYIDSQVALYWIQGTHKEWKPFVEHRVCEIRRNVKPSLWRYCPGRTNPADLPSRGLTISARAVTSSSKETCALPITLRRQRLVDLTILSNAPPHQGARSTLNNHSMPNPARYSLIVSSSKTDLRYLEAALNVLPLSEMNLLGNPLLAENLFKHRRKVSVDWFGVASK